MRLDPKVIRFPFTCDLCGHDLSCRAIVTADVDLTTLRVLGMRHVVDPDDLDSFREHATSHGF